MHFQCLGAGKKCVFLAILRQLVEMRMTVTLIFVEMNLGRRQVCKFLLSPYFTLPTPPTVGQKGEVSQKFAKAYEFAFGSEVAKTAERMQGTSHLSMFLKSICEQNSIS